MNHQRHTSTPRTMSLRGRILVALGLFIIISTLIDAWDGEFHKSTRFGSGPVIYQTTDPASYRSTVLGQCLLGLFPIAVGWFQRTRKT